MISDALFSNSQARLYPWLFGQPNRAFHLNELRRLSGLGSASLQRELNRLVSAGLVDGRAVGNMRQFQANPDSPVFTELVALTHKTLGIVPIIRSALESLQTPPKAAWVYGSVARQSDTARSDIDLMLVGEKLRLGDVLAALEPAQQQLARQINPTCYTPADFARRRAEPGSFVNRVLAQPMLPLIGNANELAGAR
ncbi:MAG: transcriptional regulator [Hylemonella sp.]|nr:transcriptional regulator [Hylemonella sp.]